MSHKLWVITSMSHTYSSLGRILTVHSHSKIVCSRDSFASFFFLSIVYFGTKPEDHGKIYSNDQKVVPEAFLAQLVSASVS